MNRFYQDLIFSLDRLWCECMHSSITSKITSERNSDHSSLFPISVFFEVYKRDVYWEWRLQQKWTLLLISWVVSIVCFEINAHRSDNITDHGRHKQFLKNESSAIQFILNQVCLVVDGTNNYTSCKHCLVLGYSPVDSTYRLI